MVHCGNTAHPGCRMAAAAATTTECARVLENAENFTCTVTLVDRGGGRGMCITVGGIGVEGVWDGGEHRLEDGVGERLGGEAVVDFDLQSQDV